jgi:ankyrin repeat protein
MQENKQIVEKLIIAKADVNEIDDHMKTPLLKCCRHNSRNEILELLLKHGARYDQADDEGNTPLHFAAMRGSVEIAKYLINLGANPYARNNQELVPYEVAHLDHVRPEFQVCPVCKKSGTIICNYCTVIKYCDIEC